MSNALEPSVDASVATAGEAQRPRSGLPYAIIEPLVALTDATLIVVSSLVGGVSYHLVANGQVGDMDAYVGLGLVACVSYALAGYHFDIYRLTNLLQRHRDYVRVLTSWSLAVLAFVVVLFLFKIGAQVSRGGVVGAAVVGAAALVAWRRLAKRSLRLALVRGTILGRRALVVGTADELAHLGTRDLLVTFGAEEVDRVALPILVNRKIVSPLQRAAVARAIERSRGTSIEEVLLVLPWTNLPQIEFVTERFRVSPLPVRLIPDRAVRTVLRRKTLGTRQCLLVDLQRGPLSTIERGMKRLLDLAVASLALVILAPLMLLAAVAIKLDSPGPVIFRQRRNGFNEREFLIFKFRSMTVLEDGAVVTQATRRDPRVTRVGRFLRRTSIDELPQLFNVLRGDMSIVGPRPHAIAHDDEYSKIIGQYAYRHHVKPGITGWAQVNGCRGETPHVSLMEKRVSLDIWYINNWNLGLDLRILLKTTFELLRHHNAY
ncbi:UDP-glucose:undecaprenyl-phosphate glucose-1-phosphate transferase [Rhodoplanes serenus]|uniref:UDP-glucose:undecaprenyl-phosphate glucose-1-phosphate transferase n=1 Tax=Rhodoplanes serenus TaxID=200615 RepID=A0A447CYN9_9BRAD|nr:undecaprenyl-phosphate glucose phosphotransferase [Rhodoplanes serenus]VCU10389.1 UDP-glucose:undecaprenyl-phosphate glucose-1-phosphate transferase [Rhodoplanes serenus]